VPLRIGHFKGVAQNPQGLMLRLEHASSLKPHTSSPQTCKGDL
jgi:hypothetical protein